MALIRTTLRHQEQQTSEDLRPREEYTATATPAAGGTETVYVKAHSYTDAHARLRAMGYRDIRNVTR